MGQYKGSVTTVGNSEAIQLEKNLFRQHPEFARKTKVTASVFAPGKILISLDDKFDSTEEDPILGAFLSFIEKDMKEHPHRIKPFSKSKYKKSMELTAGVKVSDSDVIPDDITL